MRFKRAGFLTKIVVLALLVYMATSLLDLRSQIQMLEQVARDKGFVKQNEELYIDIAN